MKRKGIILLLLMFTLVMMSSCGDKSTPPNSDTTPTNQVSTVPDDTAWSKGDAAATYINILTSDAYYIKYRSVVESEGQKMDVLTETALVGEDVAAITTMGELGSAVIVKGGTLYMVDHENKTVLVSSSGLALNESTFPVGEYSFKSSGSADFFGVAQKYEEYTTDAGIVRFFFDGKKLIGFESGEGAKNMQLEVLELSRNIPKNIFDIPTDYEVIDF
ncbi:MAG: hypothetical protein FWG61_07625 [Firmicutes bacterium]|nr:hypothetical protein [Bacillota bacterium]